MKYFIYTYSALLFVLFAGLLAYPGYAAYEGTATDYATTSGTSTTFTATTTLYFFHSPTCPHCRKEQKFLDVMEDKYPALTVLRYEAADTKYQPLMVKLAQQHGAEQYLGLVPLTFVGDTYVSGYMDDKTSGVEIERAIRAALNMDSNGEVEYREGGIQVPILGTIYPKDYSLPVLAIVLGFLDGVNVCSLGALVLIIGLALKLQRRRAVLLFGGLYILTTSLVYGGLIVIWYQVFDYFTAYITLMKVGVALLALGGGLYFLREYLRMRRDGATCTFQESPIVASLMKRTGSVLEDGGRLISILAAIFVFAFVITVVEFPCSAAIPVVFAGILADAGLSTVGYLGYIALFILFYMLDEIIIFAIAAYRLRIWMSNASFAKPAVLVEAMVLIGIGAWYLLATFGVW